MLDIVQTTSFSAWLEALRDRQARHKILARLARMQLGNLGDCKPVGGGVSEARIHHGAGYRLYFFLRGNTLIVMLAGGDKSSQTRDIKQAKQLADTWR